MLASACDRNDTTRWTKAANLNGCGSVVVCAIAKLAVEIGSPREYRPIGFQGKAMLIAGRDCDHSAASSQTADQTV